MKLRNKKTGEIIDIYKGEITLHYNQGRKTIHFKYLEDLEEWEDYEEPKHDYYFIRDGGNIDCHWYQKLGEITERRKAVGNYFETKEEAEKAVEKLKAWKRLKDKGFRFDVVPSLGHCDDEKFDISIIATMPAKWWYNDKVVDDIHYAFGGEE